MSPVPKRALPTGSDEIEGPRSASWSLACSTKRYKGPGVAGANVAVFSAWPVIDHGRPKRRQSVSACARS